MTLSALELRPIPIDDFLEVVGHDAIRIKGHRIGLEHIVERYQDGWSPEQIALDFPGLALPSIYSILAYYLQNQADVDAYVVRVNARMESAYALWKRDPSPATQRMRKLWKQQRQGHSG